MFTPEDGGSWTLAKLEAHVTDIGYSQIIEHLVQIHFVMEAVCVVLKRQIPSQHPLHQILKFHCREITVPNKFGTPAIVSEGGFIYRLFAYGNNGAVKLIRDSYDSTTWDVTDFRENIKVSSEREICDSNNQGDLSINQSIDQSINQSIDQSIHPCIHPSINQSINRWIDQFVSQPIGQ